MSDEEFPRVTDKPKKRKINGRDKENRKKQRLSSHQTGEDCQCSRHKCFEVTNEEDRQKLIASFNELKTKDLQDSFLSTLIRLDDVARRRPRPDTPDVAIKPKGKTYKYIVKVHRGDGIKELDVCLKAFLSIFGVSHKRVRTIQTALKETGLPPQDKRGKHNNHRKLCEISKQRVIDHISSFKGRTSHYSQKKSKRVYLPDTLDISKLYQDFISTYPNETLSYETYRTMFYGNFNISFGYPRSDTCSTCDQQKAVLKSLDAKLKTKKSTPEGDEIEEDHLDPATRAQLEAEQTKTNLLREIHLRKADVFYERKRAAKHSANRDSSILSLAFDFHKELQLPNKTTNDIFYRRQLSLHSFNIHVLAGDKVYIYTYDETIAKRGSDDVCSLLFHFIKNYVPEEVKSLQLFCDGCAGQNKNWTMFRFLFAQVHFWRRFNDIKISFPIRGHSYMECDRDLVLVNKKLPAELPQEWVEAFRSARANPSPFNVIVPTQDCFIKISEHLKPLFKATCPVKTRPIREVRISSDRPMVMFFRNNWNGIMEAAVLVPRYKDLQKRVDTTLATSIKKSYTHPLPISEAKYKDLQVLKQFCDPQNHAFYDGLPHDGSLPNILHDPLSDSDSDEVE